MPRWGWRRAAAGLCTASLVGVASACWAYDLFEPQTQTGSSSTASPSGSPGELGKRWAWPLPTPSPSRQPPPDISPSPVASETYVPATYTENGIPEVALRAYRHAADLLGRSDPSCRVHWSLLAAIGRVESDHGRYGGSTLYRSGATSPPIFGLVLDGSGETARILDTDGGRLDGNATFDRAVGPMQFLPGTWDLVGVDGDGDGTADPSNIFDAALSAGRYLCAGGADLSDPAQLRSAVFRYNHSTSYVELVLSIAAQYREGIEATPVPPVPDDVSPPKPFDPPKDEDIPPATSGDPPASDRDDPERNHSTPDQRGGEPTPSESPRLGASGPQTNDGRNSPNGQKDSTPRGDTTPPKDENTSPPGDSDKTTPRGNGDNDTAPPKDEDTSPPPDGHKTTPPPDDGQTTPPDDGDKSTPPPDDGKTTPPPKDETSPPPKDETTPPPDEDETRPPDDGQTTPPDDGQTTPPDDGKKTPQPDEDETTSPPPDDGKTTPPPDEDKTTSPGEGGKSTAPPKDEDSSPSPEGSPSPSPEDKTSPPEEEKDQPRDETSPSPDGNATTPPAKEPTHTPSDDDAALRAKSLSPDSGVAGDEVTVKGSGLEDATASFGGKEAATVSASDTELVVEVPPVGQPGRVQVTVGEGEQTSDDLRFTHRPEVTGFAPNPAVPGEELAVRGTGLGEDSRVTLVAARTDKEFPVTDGIEYPEPGKLVFTAPRTLAPGRYALTVTANDVASDQVTVEVRAPDGK